MSQYVIYDPTNSIAKYFPLPHSEQNEIDSIKDKELVIAVEDEKLQKLIEANKGHLCAIFVTTSRLAKDFSRLKKVADFVLEMPADKEEIEALAKVLSGEILTSEVDMSKTLPPELLQKYQSSIFQKLEEVESLIEQMRINPTKELLETLRNSVHKFAGNAASYGYIASTPLCRAHEAFLESCYTALPSKEELNQKNKTFFRKFRLTMQKLAIKASP